MIKLENVKVFNFEGAFRGLRNPMNSWHLSDSIFGIMDENEIELAIEEVAENYSLSEKIHKPYEEASQFLYENGVNNFALERGNNTVNTILLGPNDLNLAQRMIAGGTPESKFLRQIFISMDITAPLYW